MESLIKGLPPEIADRIHPDWQKNETDYWANREDLLSKYQNQWIAYTEGSVIASSSNAVAVFHVAQKSNQHPFVACVGREHEPVRMRRATFSYDEV